MCMIVSVCARVSLCVCVCACARVRSCTSPMTLLLYAPALLAEPPGQRLCPPLAPGHSSRLLSRGGRSKGGLSSGHSGGCGGQKAQLTPLAYTPRRPSGSGRLSQSRCSKGASEGQFRPLLLPGQPGASTAWVSAAAWRGAPLPSADVHPGQQRAPQGSPAVSFHQAFVK